MQLSKRLLLPVLFVLFLAQGLFSVDFISIPRTDWLIMKNLLQLLENNLQTASLKIGSLETNLKKQMELSETLSRQLQTALEKSDRLQALLISQESSYEKLETSLKNMSRQDQIKKILLIVIPIALTVLAIAGFGAGIYIGLKI